VKLAIHTGRGKQDTKDVPLPGSLSTSILTVMSFNNGLTLKHADTNAFCLVDWKGRKRDMLNKLRSHAAAIVAD